MSRLLQLVDLNTEVPTHKKDPTVRPYFASFQFFPVPISTFNGTLSG
jgi:hypothetical protein